MCAQDEEFSGDALEPPVPAGLRELSAPLDSLIEFLGIDKDLVEVAASVSAPLKEGPSRKALATWVRGLPANEKDDLLIDFLSESSERCRLELLQRFQRENAVAASRNAGVWDPAHHETDRQSRDALAARGYWQAFQKVKGSVSKVLAGGNAGAIARADHREWHRELFEPCVPSGLIQTSALTGYRNDAVYLRNSRYVPPRWEAVRDAMPALFDLIEAEPEPSVRAVLGHSLFGYIHPYPDGNGRMARFLMNVLLASGRYPWTVVRVEDRAEYLSALDSASIDVDASQFAKFIAERVRWSLKKSERSF